MVQRVIRSVSLAGKGRGEGRVGGLGGKEKTKKTKEKAEILLVAIGRGDEGEKV